ncbi:MULTISPECIES: hypothetical protein [Moraxella]|uniref:Uncharacterized protein n=1 Tax=Moraxella catarrhalis TaxID=480 RepID=A0A7Z0UZR4_MORCA|nr:hypothetical protein [Moraxella catarrhalis]OAV01794.1 hypothetical protein AO382_0160 [Moraxella catarrhalis]STY82271.1 Uncharacterised protein [Moraxella catarrhalis]
MAFNSAKYKIVKNQAKTMGFVTDLETFIYGNQKAINIFKLFKYIGIFGIVVSILLIVTIIGLFPGIAGLALSILCYIYSNKMINEHLSFIEYAKNEDPDFR